MEIWHLHLLVNSFSIWRKHHGIAKVYPESCFDFKSVKSERREIDRRFRDLVPSAFITWYIFPTSSSLCVTSFPTGQEHHGQCSSEVFCLCGWPNVPWIDTFIFLDSFFSPSVPILVKAKSHSVTLRQTSHISYPIHYSFNLQFQYLKSS